jgi:hypothetical protein
MMRRGLCTSSGAALPFVHIALPVGCPVAGLTLIKRSFSTTLMVPQRERQSVQKPAFSSVFIVSDVRIESGSELSWH